MGGSVMESKKAQTPKAEPEIVDKKHFDVLIGKKTPQEALRHKSDEVPQEIQKIETKIAQAEMEYSMMASRYKQHIKMQEAYAVGGDQDNPNYNPLNPYTEDDKSRIFDFTAKASKKLAEQE